MGLLKQIETNSDFVPLRSDSKKPETYTEEPHKQGFTFKNIAPEATAVTGEKFPFSLEVTPSGQNLEKDEKVRVQTEALNVYGEQAVTLTNRLYAAFKQERTLGSKQFEYTKKVLAPEGRGPGSVMWNIWTHAQSLAEVYYQLEIQRIPLPESRGKDQLRIEAKQLLEMCGPEGSDSRRIIEQIVQANIDVYIGMGNTNRLTHDRINEVRSEAIRH